jgi:hypothetical protein
MNSQANAMNRASSMNGAAQHASDSRQTAPAKTRAGG